MEANCNLKLLIDLICYFAIYLRRKNSECNKTVVVHLQEELKAEFKDEYADNIIQSIISLYCS